MPKLPRSGEPNHEGSNLKACTQTERPVPRSNFNDSNLKACTRIARHLNPRALSQKDRYPPSAKPEGLMKAKAVNPPCVRDSNLVLDPVHVHRG